MKREAACLVAMSLALALAISTTASTAQFPLSSHRSTAHILLGRTQRMRLRGGADPHLAHGHDGPVPLTKEAAEAHCICDKRGANAAVTEENRKKDLNFDGFWQPVIDEIFSLCKASVSDPPPPVDWTMVETMVHGEYIMQLDVMGESDKECLGSRFLEHEGKMKEAEDGYLAGIVKNQTHVGLIVAYGGFLGCSLYPRGEEEWKRHLSQRNDEFVARGAPPLDPVVLALLCSIATEIQETKVRPEPRLISELQCTPGEDVGVEGSEAQAFDRFLQAGGKEGEEEYEVFKQQVDQEEEEEEEEKKEKEEEEKEKEEDEGRDITDFNRYVKYGNMDLVPEAGTLEAAKGLFGRDSTRKFSGDMQRGEESPGGEEPN